jgi:hypothetical protein
MKWCNYPKVYPIGHGIIADLLANPVVVTEKIDGSQFSFGILDDGLHIHSHHQDITNVDLPYGLFTEAIRWVRDNQTKLHRGWLYRGEVVQKQRHNIITYQRVPRNHIILFDINTNIERYLGYSEMVSEGHRLGLEVVPLFYYGSIQGVGDLKNLIVSKPSILGGRPEGCVVKNYQRASADGHVLMGKYVTEQFMEVKRSLKPEPGEDWLDAIVKKYKTEARWDKAVIHLAEQAKLELTTRDIGQLLIELERDLMAECSQEIAADLLNHWRKDIVARVRSGFPDWYKKQLEVKAFDAKMSQENWPLKSMMTEVNKDDVPP